MKKRILVVVYLALILLFASTASAAGPKSVTLTILYDNYTAQPELKAEWGFSCLIHSVDQTILFDTGRTSQIFDHNLDQLHVKADRVDAVVISHNHSDHTGNLFNFLSNNNSVTVYLPASIPKPFAEKVEKSGASVQRAGVPLKIGNGLILTGEIPGKVINEQSLVLQTAQGPVVVVGCAHPGVSTIVGKARQIVDQDIYMVVGGFHMLRMSADQINKEIRLLQKAGVRKIAPTHCTGDTAIQLFKEAFGDHYVRAGVGKVITMPAGP